MNDYSRNNYSRNIGVVGMAYKRVPLPCLNAVPECRA